MPKQPTKWEGWISIHDKQGNAFGEALARSPTYAFTTDYDDTLMAESELRRLWDVAGKPVDNPNPSGSNLTSYPNLKRLS